MVTIQFLTFLLVYLIGVVGVFLLIVWLIIIIYRIYLTLIKYRKYLHASDIDSHVRSQLLYALKTVRNRDIFLVALILLDILNMCSFSFILPFLYRQVYLTESVKTVVKEVFAKCDIAQFPGYNYIHPVTTFFFIMPFAMLFISQFMLLSYLNLYLAGRYLGHSLPKRVTYKYVFYWIIQCLMQGFLIIPKIQLFVPLILGIFLVFNWINLIHTSRKMSRAIQSKMKEIRLFEWNPTHYRNHYTNYKYYRITMGFLISAFFFLIMAVIFLFIVYYLLVILVGNCYLDKVFGLNLNITLTHHETEIIREVTANLMNIFAFPLAVIFSFLLFLPSLCFFLFYLVSFLYNRCTGKVDMRRIQNALFEPLIDNRY